MSRVRKVDRTILDESSYLDIDEQEELIREFSEGNRGFYKMYSQALMIFEITQVIVVMVMNKVSRMPMISAVLASILLSLVELTEFEYRQAVRGANVVVVVVLLYYVDLEHLVYVLPAINLGCNYYLTRSYRYLAKDIGGLDRMKYKFKSV
mmetsp:Transcript_2098/g.2045  ORF Transcript_2098/g.2045 Transcript_2098/m.2045 type:complete len:151 (+) Transcript_2098:106-558(+)